MRCVFVIVPSSTYRITGHLGSGQFCTVHKGVWQSPVGAIEVAVKQLQSGASEEEEIKFLQEAAINGQFKHPNVVKLMGVVTMGEPVSLWSVMLVLACCHFTLLTHTAKTEWLFHPTLGYLSCMHFSH